MKKKIVFSETEYKVYLTGKDEPVIVSAIGRGDAVLKIRRQGITESIERIEG